MNKYQLAFKRIKDVVVFNKNYSIYRDSLDNIQELIDKEKPIKPKMVMLFGEEVPTCAREGCGVGLNPNESIWHKSSYCGNCGQKIDWGKDDE